MIRKSSTTTTAAATAIEILQPTQQAWGNPADDIGDERERADRGWPKAQCRRILRAHRRHHVLVVCPMDMAGKTA